MDPLDPFSRIKKTLDKVSQETSGIHAILIYGHAGTQKTEFAKLLACHWTCSSPQKNLSLNHGKQEHPCCNCDSCKAIHENRSPDLLLIEPAPPSFTIRLEAITKSKSSSEKSLSIQEFLRTPPLKNQKKIVILSKADRMNQEATNALLKTLEEPETYVKFILTATSLSQIPETLLSRAILIPCPLPSSTALKAEFGNLSKTEELFGEGIPKNLYRIKMHDPIYQELYTFFEHLADQPSEASLKNAEYFKNLSQKIEKEMNLTPKEATCEALRCLALWMQKTESHLRFSLNKVLLAHQKIFRNLHLNYLIQDLFCNLTSK